DIKMAAATPGQAAVVPQPTGETDRWPGGPPQPSPVKFVSKVAKSADEQRLIIATCEKGAVEDVDSMRTIKAGLDSKMKANPNFVDVAAREVWRSRNPEKVADEAPSRTWTRTARERAAAMARRPEIRIGMPRVLN